LTYLPKLKFLSASEQTILLATSREIPVAVWGHDRKIESRCQYWKISFPGRFRWSVKVLATFEILLNWNWRKMLFPWQNEISGDFVHSRKIWLSNP
jgi:hypothetical protein